MRNADIFSGKPVTVFGLNRSGLAIAKLLLALGANVTVTDSREREALSAEIEQLTQQMPSPSSQNPPLKFYLGGHPDTCIAAAALIIVSPGVPLDIPILCKARAKRIPILGELEVAASLCPAPIVAITGTKGKSTTTLLTAAILETSRRFTNVCVAGNIGLPLSAEVQNLTSRDIVVLEASSFQLESTVTFHPIVSVVLNISPDHLDRHRTMRAYTRAKQQICANQTAADWIVLNSTDEQVADFAALTTARTVYFQPTECHTHTGSSENVPKQPRYATQGTYLQRDETGNLQIFGNIGTSTEHTENACQKPQFLCHVKDIPLAGAHNIRNTLAAAAVGLIYGVTAEHIRIALQQLDLAHPAFKHAFERVRTVHGVQFIDDSKATNVDSVKAALESVPSSPSSEARKNVLLIMGGYDKGNDYTPLIRLVREKVKKGVMLGGHTQRIQNALAAFTDILPAKTMTEAVQVAYQHAVPGDVVLLSPANASFDMYTDYKARGNAFKEAVHALQS